MEKTVHYRNLLERKALVAENEALGLRMLSDTFDQDWKPGTEPHGTMIFTDVQEVLEPTTDWKALYVSANTDTSKLDVIAKWLGLK
jgi:hypothetical protein